MRIAFGLDLSRKGPHKSDIERAMGEHIVAELCRTTILVVSNTPPRYLPHTTLVSINPVEVPACLGKSDGAMTLTGHCMNIVCLIGGLIRKFVVIYLYIYIYIYRSHMRRRFGQGWRSKKGGDGLLRDLVDPGEGEPQPRRVAWNNRPRYRDVINLTEVGVAGVGGAQSA